MQDVLRYISKNLRKLLPTIIHRRIGKRQSGAAAGATGDEVPERGGGWPSLLPKLNVRQSLPCQPGQGAREAGSLLLAMPQLWPLSVQAGRSQVRGLRVGHQTHRGQDFLLPYSGGVYRLLEPVGGHSYGCGYMWSVDAFLH